MIVTIKRNSIGRWGENFQKISKNIEQNIKEIENTKEEVREMKDTQYSFNRNLRKIIQKIIQKIIIITENNTRKFPRPNERHRSSYCMRTPGSEKDEEERQIARHILVELQSFEDIKILRALWVQIRLSRKEKDSSCCQTWQTFWISEDSGTKPLKLWGKRGFESGYVYQVN